MLYDHINNPSNPHQLFKHGPNWSNFTSFLRQTKPFSKASHFIQRNGGDRDQNFARSSLCTSTHTITKISPPSFFLSSRVILGKSQHTFSPEPIISSFAQKIGASRGRAKWRRNYRTKMLRTKKPWM